MAVAPCSFAQALDLPIWMVNDIAVSGDRWGDASPIAGQRFCTRIQNDAIGGRARRHRRQHARGAAVRRHHLVQHLAAVIEDVNARPRLGHASDSRGDLGGGGQTDRNDRHL